MNRSFSGRYRILGLALMIVPVMIFLKLVKIQLDPVWNEDARRVAEENSGWYEPVKPPRGQIFDRWGRPLATNRLVYEIGADIDFIENPETIASVLAQSAGIDYAETIRRLNPSDEKIKHVTLARFVAPEKIETLKLIQKQFEEHPSAAKGKKAASLAGIYFSPVLTRYYPEKSLASNIVGFVAENEDKKQELGYFGVEEKYDELLASISKPVWRPRDPNQVGQQGPVPGGADLVLTISNEIQIAMEAVIDQGVREAGAKGGTIVVLDPRNGEILAMAVTSRMDLNDISQYHGNFPTGVPFNKAISQDYEPGSVFKVLTMAAAIDSGKVKPDTVFIDRGVLEMGGTYIYDWNRGAWGQQTMLGCMQHSLNVCLAWVAQQLGTKDFYRYMNNFGIGHMTEVELGGEVAGYLKSPGDENWYEADLGTNSFGQGVSSTALQMAVASSAVANHGRIMAPHIVRSIVNKGYQHNFDERVVSTPIRAEAAQALSEMLAISLEEESSDALTTGYRVAGKTGTAEIPTPMGYTSNETNASFVGWGPVDDPRFLVYVWLEKPSVSPWGSVVAAPVFQQAVEKLVVLLNIPPDDVRQQLRAQAQ